jgi:hypothetical protein
MLRCNDLRGTASGKGDIQMQSKDSGTRMRNVRMFSTGVIK